MKKKENFKTGKFLNVSHIYIIIITVSGIEVEESRGKLEMKFEKLMYQLVEEEGEF